MRIAPICSNSGQFRPGRENRARLTGKPVPREVPPTVQATENPLPETEREFHPALEKLPVGLAHVSCGDGRLLRVNARLCEWLGCTREELAGLRVERLVPREDRDAAARLSLRLLGSELARGTLEMALLPPGGGRLSARVALALERDAAGRPGHFVAVVEEAAPAAARAAAPAPDPQPQRDGEEQRLARHAERQALLLELSAGMLQAGSEDLEPVRSVFQRLGEHLKAELRFEAEADVPAGVLQWMKALGLPTVTRRTGFPRPALPAPPAQGRQGGDWLVLGEPFVAGPGDLALLGGLGARACITQPCHAPDGRLLGALVLSSTRRGLFSPEEADLFRTLCHFVLLACRRIHSERELHKRKQQYRMALDARQLGSWRREIWDSDIYHLDERAQAHYGLARADVPEAALVAQVHPEDRERVEQYIAQGKRQSVGQDGKGIEYRVVHADGTTRWLSVHAKLVLEQRDGTPVLVRHGLSADITARKRTEQALQEALADLQRAQAAARVGSWRFDLRQRQGHCSAEACRILGLSPGRPLDPARFLACVHPEDRPRVAQAWKAAARGEPCEIEHRVGAGSQVRRVRQRAELEADAHGQPVAGFVTLQELDAAG